ncbi:MAG: hypothetical protein JJ992_28160, partial [Planctomycetes bacterium]|nr:hypothetical protein [Planctomycetota bacterium]
HPNQCRLVVPICYRHIVQLGDTTTNYQIQPGDRIFVSSLTFWQELGQTFFPQVGQECPHCWTPQQPCPELSGGLPLASPGHGLPANSLSRRGTARSR